jgi:hypothetical protein
MNADIRHGILLAVNMGRIKHFYPINSISSFLVIRGTHAYFVPKQEDPAMRQGPLSI